MDQDAAKEIVCFQVSRRLTNLSTNFLILLEDMLGEGIPVPYARTRKKVLDALNDNKRELLQLIDSFDITLKK